uniref:C2H2-type domain-containing protein n=1 Tax=Anopheles farauti TaxID=69004 RepID=A0A182Q2D4_9DIPT
MSIVSQHSKQKTYNYPADRIPKHAGESIFVLDSKSPEPPCADPLSEDSTMDLSAHSYDTDFKPSVSDSDNTADNTLAKKPRTGKTVASKNSELLYGCDECELKLSTKTALYKHRRIHQKEECPICNLLFRADKIKEHYAKKHPNDTSLLTNGEFRCENCLELFENEKQLTEHRSFDARKECPVCLKISTASHIKKHLAAIESGAIKKELSDDDNDTLNIVSNPSLDGKMVYYCTTRFKCRKCEEKFYDKVTLAKHQRSHRTAECPICHKTFRTDKMKQHIASRHVSGEGAINKIFRCRDCRKLFENEDQLTAHQNTHKRPLCPVCKESASAEHIEKHLASLNAINFSDDSDGDLSDELGDDESLVADENNCYKCDECDRTFETIFRLQKHRRIHRKKECPFCPRLFRPDMIVNHIATKHPEQQQKVKKEETLPVAEESAPAQT